MEDEGAQGSGAQEVSVRMLLIRPAPEIEFSCAQWAEPLVVRISRTANMIQLWIMMNEFIRDPHRLTFTFGELESHGFTKSDWSHISRLQQKVNEKLTASNRPPVELLKIVQSGDTYIELVNPGPWNVDVLTVGDLLLRAEDGELDALEEALSILGPSKTFPDSLKRQGLIEVSGVAAFWDQVGALRLRAEGLAARLQAKDSEPVGSTPPSHGAASGDVDRLPPENDPISGPMPTLAPTPSLRDDPGGETRRPEDGTLLREGENPEDPQHRAEEDVASNGPAPLAPDGRMALATDDDTQPPWARLAKIAAIPILALVMFALGDYWGSRSASPAPTPSPPSAASVPTPALESAALLAQISPLDAFRALMTGPWDKSPASNPKIPTDCEYLAGGWRLVLRDPGREDWAYDLNSDAHLDYLALDSLAFLWCSPSAKTEGGNTFHVKGLEYLLNGFRAREHEPGTIVSALESLFYDDIKFTRCDPNGTAALPQEAPCDVRLRNNVYQVSRSGDLVWRRKRIPTQGEVAERVDSIFDDPGIPPNNLSPARCDVRLDESPARTGGIGLRMSLDCTPKKADLSDTRSWHYVKTLEKVCTWSDDGELCDFNGRRTSAASPRSAQDVVGMKILGLGAHTTEPVAAPKP